MRTVTAFLLPALFATSMMASEDTSPVFVESMRIVLAKKGSQVEAQQSLKLRLNANEGKISPMNIPLPENALLPRLAMEQEGVHLEKSSIVVSGETLKNEPTLAVVYQLPIASGSMDLAQDLGLDVRALQIISTWTLGKTRLSLEGFGEAKKHVITGGIEGLVISANDVKEGVIRVRLSGLDPGPADLMRIVSITLSVSFLLLGLLWWLRKKLKKHD